ncbi:MAG: MFS transporter [Sutterellaceae bacterium]|nr:MFS transporter [Burkholderiaceae bacterium]MCX7900913.1 MFS transporter [Burkholderiaceae bacterium]MDW8429753.1 MFS transporter [Sutterellaceae bacterium]
MTARAWLWSLLFGNLAIGTGVMLVAGVLNELAADLQVTPPVAGQLISAAAAVMAIGAPLAAAVTARFDRRLLLAATLAWYAAGLLACAAAPTFEALLVLRLLTVVSAAIFTPQAAAAVALLAPPETRGRAIAFTFLGWAIASVASIPASAAIAGTFGWRTAFAVAGVLAALAALGVAAALPPGLRAQALPARAWLEVARHPLLPRVLAVTVISASGQFAVFAFIAPYLLWLLEADANERAIALAWIGVFGLLGNVAVARGIDRLRADRTAALTLGAMLVGIALLPAAGKLKPLAPLALAAWGFGTFGSNSSQQVRLAEIAPALAPASIALNTSAIYLGQAVGSCLGGLLYGYTGVAWLPWLAAGLMASALVLSLAVSRQRRLAGPASTGPC